MSDSVLLFPHVLPGARVRGLGDLGQFQDGSGLDGLHPPSHISIQESAGVFAVLLGVGLISGHGLHDDFWQTLSLVSACKDACSRPPLQTLGCSPEGALLLRISDSTVFIPWYTDHVDQ